MLVETPSRPSSGAEGNKNLSLSILQRARFALGWNNPNVAENTLLRNQARVAEYAKRAQVGSPGQRAEERFVLARAKENVTRVRAAGLASGTMEEGATGMIFAIPAARVRTEGQPTSIGDTPYEFWYMSYDAVEQALNASFTDQASAEPKIDKHVYRAALGFVATQDSSHNAEQIRQVELHPLDEANLMKIARYMKSHDRHGRIPSRIEIINERILRSGQFDSGESIVNISAQQGQREEQNSRTA